MPDTKPTTPAPIPASAHTELASSAILERDPAGHHRLVVITDLPNIAVQVGDAHAELARDATGHPAIVITTDFT